MRKVDQERAAKLLIQVIKKELTAKEAAQMLQPCSFVRGVCVTHGQTDCLVKV